MTVMQLFCLNDFRRENYKRNGRIKFNETIYCRWCHISMNEIQVIIVRPINVENPPQTYRM
jgi:hypothetical protein